MAAIKRRRISKPHETCRKTRRVMTILLLTMGMVVILRIILLTIFQQRGNEPKDSSLLMRRDEKNNPVVVLTLELNDDKDDKNSQDEQHPQVHISLYNEQAPLAAHYIQQLATTTSACTKCTLYRGEPVPPYWGSPEYPDRYFDGGRWGPPYALIQGGLISNNDEIQIPPAESASTPVIQKGMVAWAGGNGGPHFFIALADHPEWKHDHTVWGEVVNDSDLEILQALLSRPLATTDPKRLPVVSNFVTPISFTIQMMASSQL